MRGGSTARVALLIAGVLSLSGCGAIFGDSGIFRDRAQDYKKAPQVPVVTVPPGKDTQTLREIYVIPQIEDKVVLEGEFEVPRPAPLVAGAGADVVRIQKLGDDSWALISLAPGQVWPQVRSFLSAAGMQVARVDARAGLIESTWLTLEGKSLPSRFRFRMEQGVQRGTSELHVLQMNKGRGEDWPRNSDDLPQEEEMLRAVAQYLADVADSSPVSMIAEQGLSAGGKISLQERADGRTYIQLGLPFDRAWASLGLALEKSSFEITDKDRSRGVYYARFIGSRDAEEAGWFDWLWGEDENPLVGEIFTVSTAREADDLIAISLQPENDELDFGRREEQDLLTLIKGNIN